MTATYYAYKTPSGDYELRQTRYKVFFEPDNGREHPHDVCAVAATVDGLKGMASRHLTGEIDWSGVEDL